MARSQNGFVAREPSEKTATRACGRRSAATTQGARAVRKVSERIRTPDSHFQGIILTFDNGSEFAKHERITKRLKCPCYFAKAGHPGQRGALEQSNGLIRRLQPKKTTRYKWMRHEKVRHVQNLINGRRRKSLAGKRPKDYLSELLLPAPTKEAPAGASLVGLGS